MKITEIIYMVAVPCLSFYGSVYNDEFSRNLLLVCALIMLFICLVAIYYINYTESGNRSIKNFDMSKNSYGTWKQKFGYSLIIASACLLISYDNLMLGGLLFLPLFVNEYIAYRIFDANQQKA